MLAILRNLVLCLVSFPHYFLMATGRLAEQLKTREWIVARITSLTERVVDLRVSESLELRPNARITSLLSPGRGKQSVWPRRRGEILHAGSRRLDSTWRCHETPRRF